MTTSPFAPYLDLVRCASPRRLAEEFDAGSAPAVTAALLTAGILVPGPQATLYPCLEAGPACPRRIIPYEGPRPETYCARAVPPERYFCCPSVSLTSKQLETYVVDARRLTAMILGWLGAESGIDAEARHDAPLTRIGYMRSEERRTRVFLARRMTSRLARDRLRDLEATGGALVIGTIREEGFPADLEERYSGRSSVRVVFLEDHLRLHDHRVDLKPLCHPPSDDPLRGGAVEQRTTSYQVLDQWGERAATDDEVAAQRDDGSLDLFVDMSVSAKGGGAAGYATIADESGVMVKRSFVLTTIQCKVLLEYVRAQGRALSPQRLECVRAAQIRDGARVVRELRARIDESRGRDQYRSIHSQKNAAGLVSEYTFRPPAGFRMAIILPASA